MSARLESNISQFNADMKRRAKALVARTASKVNQRIVVNLNKQVYNQPEPKYYVRTGNLRKSVQIEILGDLSQKVFVAAEYGVYVEYGTRHMAARPFFGPAFEETASEFEAGLKELLK